MKNVIIDYRASKNSIDALLKMGYNVVKTPKINTLYNAICGHPDIMIHLLNTKTTVCVPGFAEYFKKKMPEITVIAGKSSLRAEYPFDIAYNTARVGNNIFCLEKYTDKVILEYYYENGFNIINTKQGYAKCSICVVSSNSIITSDKNISILASKNNIDVLLINDKNILLEDFEHGFIGGATGLLEKDILAVNGNIELHNDSDKIIDFCKRYGVKIISLNNDRITDIGSIITL